MHGRSVPRLASAVLVMTLSACGSLRFREDDSEERARQLEEVQSRVMRFADEYVGLTNTGDSKVSVSRVQSPEGWLGAWQFADYHEYRIVLAGTLNVEVPEGEIEVVAGQALDVRPGEWVRYSTPVPADYVTVCLPAFSRASVHRND